MPLISGNKNGTGGARHLQKRLVIRVGTRRDSLRPPMQGLIIAISFAMPLLRREDPGLPAEEPWVLGASFFIAYIVIFFMAAKGQLRRSGASQKLGAKPRRRSANAAFTVKVAAKGRGEVAKG